ncbi:MAG: hypothetical protein O7C61_12360 [SAR324 cluster bacterium]|nr:hypothetical protein [SAR324 cluster bacterium]
MNAEHLEHLTQALHRARPRLSRTHGLKFKAVFGAVAGYVHHHIFISCGNFGLALKLPPGRCTALLAEQGCKPLRYFPNGHIKKNYVVLPGRITGNAVRFKALVNESIAYVVQ